jgi:hypothetical protein
MCPSTILDVVVTRSYFQGTSSTSVAMMRTLARMEVFSAVLTPERLLAYVLSYRAYRPASGGGIADVARAKA